MERLQLCEKTYMSLFDYYKQRSIPQILDQVDDVQEVFYQNVKLENNFWAQKAKKETIFRNVLIIGILILAFAVFGLLVFMYQYFANCMVLNATCTWDNLPTWQKNKVMNATIPYQGRMVKIQKLTNGIEQVLHSLNDGQLRAPNDIRVNDMKFSPTFEYFERIFTFSYQEYSLSPEGRYIYLNTYSYTEEEIVKIKQKILSGESGSGISTTLKEIAFRETKINPSRWVSYLDFKSVLESNLKILKKYENRINWTHTDLTRFLFTDHGPTSLFQYEIFSQKFLKGDVILFIDHIDVLFMENEKLAETFLEVLLREAHEKTEIWIGSRDWLGETLEKIFKKKNDKFEHHLKLVPIYGEGRNNFIDKRLKFFNLTQNEQELTKKNIEKLLSSFNVYYNGYMHQFDNICLLNLMVTHAHDSLKSNHTNKLCLYTVLENYNNKIFRLFSKNFISNIETTNADNFFELIALKLLNNTEVSSFQKTKMDLLINDLDKASNDCKSGKEKMYCIENYIKKGILKKEENYVKFSHDLQYEFYVAKYIVNFLGMIDQINFDNEVNKNKINFLISIYQDPERKFIVIQNCINSYVGYLPSKKLNLTKSFINAFKKSYAEFKNSTRIDIGKELKNIFMYEEEILKIIEK